MEDVQVKTMFKKNLAVFQRFCPELVEAVKTANCTGYTFFRSESGDLNLKKGNDFAFHSRVNPKKEADLWFHSLHEINSVQLLVVFGVGLAYYYDPLKVWLKNDPTRMVIFLEPDMSLLHLLFQTQRGTDVLKDPQVAVLGVQVASLNSMQSSIELIADLMLHRLSQLSEMNAYVRVYRDAWSRIKKLVRFHASEAAIQANFIRPKTFQEHMLNAANNIWKLPQSRLIYPLKGALQGIPAVICGAGPSIVHDIPLLKQYQDNALIVGAGTGMNILNKNGIIPALGVVVDPYDTTRIRIVTNYAYEVPACFKLSVNHEALAFLHGETLYFKGQDSYGIENYLEDQLGLRHFPRIFSPLSSTLTCLGITSFLGCNPIAMLGVDLAYTDRKRYPDLIKDLTFNQINDRSELKLVHPQHLLFAEALNGGLVETRADWIREGSFFEKIKRFHPEVSYINATSQGLLLPGIEKASFQAFAKENLKKTVDLDNILHAAIQDAPYLDVSYDQIQGLMKKWKQSLRETNHLIHAILEELCRLCEANEDYPSHMVTSLCKSLHEQDMYRYILSGRERSFHKYFFENKYPIIYRPEYFEANEKALAQVHYDIGLYLFLSHLTSLMENALPEDRESSFGMKTDPMAEKKIPNSGELNGRHLTYYPDGAVKTALSYRSGQQQGPFTFYSSTGAVLARGQFHDGKKEGENLQYYPSGSLYSKKRYEAGKKHGIHEYYYASGKQKASIPFKRGKLDGCVKLFYPGGGLWRKIAFSEGEMNGFERTWNEKGQLVHESEYAKGEPVGYFRRWHANGQLKEEKKFYDSTEHYDETHWSSEGKIIQRNLYFPQRIGEMLEGQSEVLRNGLNRIKERLDVKRESP